MILSLKDEEKHLCSMMDDPICKGRTEHLELLPERKDLCMYLIKVYGRVPGEGEHWVHHLAAARVLDDHELPADVGQRGGVPGQGAGHQHLQLGPHRDGDHLDMEAGQTGYLYCTRVPC